MNGRLIPLISVLLLVIVALFAVQVVAKKKTTEKDPRECEVCISNLEAIDKLIPDGKKKNTDEIEKAIQKHCTLSGFGSDWKPNPKLTSQKDIKMCYIFEPIKKAISTPYATGMPKEKVCRRLEKENPEVCSTKYPPKVEKKEGEAMDYNKLKVKELKEILNQRNVKCNGCSEKAEFVKRCQETEDLEF